MFPKTQRIVKTKEIQKALKAPFRGSCLFGQILLSPKSFSTSTKTLRSKNLRVTQPTTIKKFIEKSPNLAELKPQFDKEPIQNETNLIQISTTKPEDDILEPPAQQSLSHQDKLGGNNLKSVTDSKIDFSNKGTLATQNLNQVKDFPRKHSQAELAVTLAKKPSQFRLLCVVSKKIHKKANQRNKIRRRILAIFAGLRAKKRLPPDIDCVIIIRNKDILTATFAQYEQAFIPAVASLYQKSVKK